MVIKAVVVTNAIKFTLSRPGLKLKLKYILLFIIFFPIVLLQSKGGASEASKESKDDLVGDDIYPLF